LRTKLPSRLIGVKRIGLGSFDVASVGLARGSGKGSGSQAEWNADKQRSLLLISWSRLAPEADAFGADLRMEQLGDVRSGKKQGADKWLSEVHALPPMPR
jgi:hypothetical protein